MSDERRSSDNDEKQSAKLYISGLSERTTKEELNDLFRKWGKIYKAKVVLDQTTQRSKGYGFVTYESYEDAQEALRVCSRQKIELGGCVINVEKAHGYNSFKDKDRKRFHPYGRLDRDRRYTKSFDHYEPSLSKSLDRPPSGDPRSRERDSGDGRHSPKRDYREREQIDPRYDEYYYRDRKDRAPSRGYDYPPHFMPPMHHGEFPIPPMVPSYKDERYGGYYREYPFRREERERDAYRMYPPPPFPPYLPPEEYYRRRWMEREAEGGSGGRGGGGGDWERERSYERERHHGEMADRNREWREKEREDGKRSEREWAPHDKERERADRSRSERDRHIHGGSVGGGGVSGGGSGGVGGGSTGGSSGGGGGGGGVVAGVAGVIGSGREREKERMDIREREKEGRQQDNGKDRREESIEHRDDRRYKEKDSSKRDPYYEERHEKRR